MIPASSTDVRPDTGLYNAKLGLWLFLAAEAMFFGALFSSFVFLRTAATDWPNGADILPRVPALATVLMLTLAATASARAWAALPGNPSGSRAWQVTGVLAGIAAVAAILVALRHETAEGMRPATNTFYALWFLMNGLLAVHTLAGVTCTWMLRSAGRTECSLRLRAVQHAECVGLYWQFLALVSLAVFACFNVT